MNNGRRVFRKKRFYRKKQANRIIIIALIIIVLVILVFLAYSVGGPIINFFKNDNINNVQTDPWTPPITTEQSDQSEQSEQVTTEEEKTTVSDNDKANIAYTIKVSDLSDIDKLDQSLSKIKDSGYKNIIVELKSYGGTFNYNTTSEFAHTAELQVTSELSAKDIADLINKYNLTPIAKISVLADNNRYGEYRDGSYKIESDQSTWLDNSPQNGGKPWLSPFESDTKEYYKYLANEITSAGFTTIICDDLIFPEFRNSDLGFIGDSVSNADRYKGLIQLVDVIKSSSNEKAEIMIETNCVDILSGKAEIVKPEEIKNTKLCINFNLMELPDQIVVDEKNVVLKDMSLENKVSTLLDIVRSKTDKLDIIPYLSLSELNTAQQESVIACLEKAGYDEYFVY